MEKVLSGSQVIQERASALSDFSTSLETESTSYLVVLLRHCV